MQVSDFSKAEIQVMFDSVMLSLDNVDLSETEETLYDTLCNATINSIDSTRFAEALVYFCGKFSINILQVEVTEKSDEACESISACLLEASENTEDIIVKAESKGCHTVVTLSAGALYLVSTVLKNHAVRNKLITATFEVRSVFKLHVRETTQHDVPHVKHYCEIGTGIAVEISFEDMSMSYCTSKLDVLEFLVEQGSLVVLCEGVKPVTCV